MITIGLFLVMLAILQNGWAAAMATIGIYMMYRGFFGGDKRKSKKPPKVIHL